jgi:hypothetical protein
MGQAATPPGWPCTSPSRTSSCCQRRPARGLVRRQGHPRHALGGDPFGLIVVQFFLAYAACSAAIVGVLHGLNALAIFAFALLAARGAAKLAPAPAPEPSSPPGIAA